MEMSAAVGAPQACTKLARWWQLQANHGEPARLHLLHLLVFSAPAAVQGPLRGLCGCGALEVPSARGVGRGAIVDVRPPSGGHVLQRASVDGGF